MLCLMFLSVRNPVGQPEKLSQENESEQFSSDLFEEAVICIKKYEGWHTCKDYPYVGYGHRLLKGEIFDYQISEMFADSLLRKDLRQKCMHFRRFGRDSLLLGVLAYNVGEFRLLGYGKQPKSNLIRKLEKGDRMIYEDYVSYCRYKGKVISSLKKRREEEYRLLFNKN